MKQSDTSPDTITPPHTLNHLKRNLPSGEDESVIHFIQHTLQQALHQHASDIHFEPYADHYRIRFRIDGVLHATESPIPHLAARIVVRLKIMAQLNIAERRLPQDGQLLFTTANQTYTFRIATLPTTYGEKIVLRIIDTTQHLFDMQDLGLSPSQRIHYQHALDKPQGLILVTGPTGSGKTVTLYSGLSYLNRGSNNICSIEDPIEIPLNGINQTAINPKTGLHFCHLLRALLRQDPDVIMIGEIRDKETAEIAIEAAQTGHLVLSTLHTNSTCETIQRLLQMGIPNYLLASSLKLIIAQRLVRQLCPHCKTQLHDPVYFHFSHQKITLSPWKAEGCKHCCGGYNGRLGLYEILTLSPEIQQAILEQQSSDALFLIAYQQGMQPLFLHGLDRVKNGDTSISELYRILGHVEANNLPT